MKTIREIFYLSIALLGLISALAFSMANYFIPIMINNIHLAIADGVSINEFSKIILGLNADGKIRFIEMHLSASIAIISLIISYFGIQGFLLSRKHLSISNLFSKRYWTFFNWSFFYSLPFKKNKGSENAKK